MSGLLISRVALLGLTAMGVPGAMAAPLVVDDDGMATAADCDAPNPTFMTIGAAVAAASTGDTIHVCPGIYVENINLTKSLTLLGAQAGVDARGRLANESIILPANPLVMTLELDTGSAGSIIDGFTFSGGTRAIESDTGPIDNLQILNNRIIGFSNSGVFLNDSGVDITVNQNEIDGSSKVGGGDLFHLDTDNFDGFHFNNNRVVNGATATGFFVDGNRNVGQSTTRLPQFSGNLIDNNLTGVNLGRKAWEDGPISGNGFSNNLFDGMQGGPKNSLISQNSFVGNGRHGLALTGFGGATDPTRGAQGNLITQNCFIGNGFAQAGAGVFFSATQFPGTISSNVARQNNIFGNAIGAQYPGSETIDAENNWWGSPTGPTHPSNPAGTGDAVVDDGDGIDFVPFLTVPAGGTPCVPTPPPPGKVTGGGQISVDNGRGSFGFNARQDGGAGSGHLNYINHVTGAHIDCTVTVITELTTTTAKFSGTCTQNGATTSFTAQVEDHGEPGKNDKFTITYGAITEGGTIKSGNIRIHQ